MGNEIKCAWCEESVPVKDRIYKNSYGEIKERRCSQCGGIIAAYLVEKQPILEEVRTFKD